jgi:tartrate-resistant acid phosphatase type 5
MLAPRATLVVALCATVGASSDSFRALVFGDWGGSPSPPYTTAAQLDVAKAMSETAEGASCVFAIGDNFYTAGIEGAEASTTAQTRFTNTFDDVYSQPSLKSLPWHIVAGNHDHKGNVTAQLAHSQTCSRWNFPSLYYSQAFPFGNQTLEVFMIDTVVWAGDWDIELNHTQPVGAADAELAESQLAWLEAGLKASTADWIFVMGHYPVFSVAEHGPTALLVAGLQPLLVKYGVAAYFCGHEHNLQHLSHSGVEYVVTGGGHGYDPSTAHMHSILNPKDAFKWKSSDSGHSVVTLTADTMHVDHYNSTAHVVYSFESQRPARPLPAAKPTGLVEGAGQ